MIDQGLHNSLLQRFDSSISLKSSLNTSNISIPMNSTTSIDINSILPEGYVYGGDFHENPNSKQFCINGMFGPDRLPHPSAYETKYYQSPIAISLIMFNNFNNNITVNNNIINENYEDLRLLVINYRSFLNFNDFNISIGIATNLNHKIKYVLMNDIQLLLANSQQYYILPKILSIFDINNENNEELIENIYEVWFDIIVTTNEATEWIPKNHEILHITLTHPILLTTLKSLFNNTNSLNNSMKLSNNNSNHILMNNLTIPNYLSNNQIEFIKDSKQITIKWNNNYSKAIISLETGLLEQWLNQFGQSILTSNITSNFYRAPTDNDNGGDFISFANRWNTFG